MRMEKLSVVVNEKKDSVTPDKLCASVWEKLTTAESELLKKRQERYARIREELKKIPAVLRLERLRQIAWKGSQTHIDRARRRAGALGWQGDAGVAITASLSQPAEHTRMEHSVLISEFSSIVAARLGVSDREAAHLYAAGMLHDIGHAAFNHVADRFLVKERGYLDHEERGIATLHSDSFGTLFEMLGLDAHSIEGIIREEGALGAIQSMCDTLSYMYFDTRYMDIPERLEPDTIEAALLDIRGVSEGFSPNDALREEWSALTGYPPAKLKKIKTVLQTRSDAAEGKKFWQTILACRATLWKDFYDGSEDALEEDARIRLVRYALDQGQISERDLLNLGDEELQVKLATLVKGPLRKYADLYLFAFGLHQDTAWERREFANEVELGLFLQEFPKDPETCVIMSSRHNPKAMFFLDKNDAPFVVGGGQAQTTNAKFVVTFLKTPSSK